jgi:hypothetical protein
VCGLQVGHQLKRRQATIERRRIVAILREAGVRTFRDVAHGRHDIAFDQPGLEKIVDHDVDVRPAGARGLLEWTG